MSTTQKKAIASVYILTPFVMMINLTSALIAYIIVSYPGVSSSTVTSLLTVPSLIGLGVSLITGPLALKINKKYLMLFVGACGLAYFAIFALVGSNGPFSMLMFAACLAGVCRGAAMTLSTSIISEYAPAEKRATLMAVNSAMINGVYAIANVACGAIAALNGGADWNNAYFVGFIILPALIAFAILMPKQSAVTAAAASGAREDPAAKQEAAAGSEKKERLPKKLIVIVLIVFLFVVCLSGFTYTYSAYVITEHKLGTSTNTGLASSIMTIAGLVIGFAYSVFSKALKKWIAPVGMFLCALSLFFMFAINTSIWIVYAAAAIMGVGINLVSPYMYAYISQITPPRLVPVALSIYMCADNLAKYFGLYILNFGAVVFGGGISGQLMTGVVAGLIAAVIVFFVMTKKPKKDQLPTAA